MLDLRFDRDHCLSNSYKTNTTLFENLRKESKQYQILSFGSWKQA